MVVRYAHLSPEHCRRKSVCWIRRLRRRRHRRPGAAKGQEGKKMATCSEEGSAPGESRKFSEGKWLLRLDSEPLAPNEARCRASRWTGWGAIFANARVARRTVTNRAFSGQSSPGRVPCATGVDNDDEDSLALSSTKSCQIRCRLSPASSFSTIADRYRARRIAAAAPSRGTFWPVLTPTRRTFWPHLNRRRPARSADSAGGDGSEPGNVLAAFPGGPRRTADRLAAHAGLGFDATVAPAELQEGENLRFLRHLQVVRHRHP